MSQCLFGLAPQYESPSFLVWVLRSLGLYGVLVPLLGIALFIGAIILVVKVRRSAVLAAYLAIVPLPFLLSLLGLTKNFITSFSVVAMADVSLSANQILTVITGNLVMLHTGVLATLPAYLVIAIGLFIRTAQQDDCGKVGVARN